MHDTKNSGFGTTAIHGGAERNPFGTLATPIYQTSTFVFENCEQGGNRFQGQEEGYIYSRLGNPTTSLLEKRMAMLEGGEAAMATSSGMGAITSVFWTALRAGDHVIADGTLYGCTFAFLSHGISRYGVEVTFVDMADPENVRAALRPNTRLVYIETPANPNLKIVDIAAVAGIAHEHDPSVVVVADNTFATPYHTRPLELGCDVVIHSATKYLNGHGDVIAGMIVGNNEFLTQVRLFGVKDMTGSVIGPFEAWLILRGIKTLEVRMERHQRNAAIIADWFKKHPKVERVYYPGLKDHPNHEVAAKQMRNGFGGMVTIELKGGRKAGRTFLDNLQLCSLAVSLGDTETLVEHPASMTHSPYSAEELKKFNISEGLVRISAGLENVDDIIADFEQALEKVDC